MNVIVPRRYVSYLLAIPINPEALTAERYALSGSVVEPERESFAELV